MVDSITSFFQLPSPGSISSSQKQEVQPTVLDLGSDNLTYNPARQVASSVFSQSASGPFADINSFLTVAKNQTGQQGSQNFNAQNFDLGTQKYRSAQDLLLRRETSAEARLKELLKGPPPQSAPAPEAPPETPEAPEEESNAFGLSIFGSYSPSGKPSLSINAGLTLDEGSTAAITTSQLSARDRNTSASNLVYQITQSPANGYLELSSDPGTEVTSFTQADLEAGIVNYVSNGDEVTQDSFNFTLSDGTTTRPEKTFNIGINPVDDAPEVTTNTGASVSPFGTVTITNANLNTTDPDTDSDALVYNASQIKRGYLQLSTNPGQSITSFTQADLDAGRVQFVNTQLNLNNAGFRFTVSDGTSTTAHANFDVTSF